MTGASHRWREFLRDAEPVAGDELSTWTRAELVAMDRRFVERLARAIKSGKERPPNGSSPPPDDHLIVAAMPEHQDEQPRA